MNMAQSRCLKINDKWITLILKGMKTWEVRRRNTTIRERIALGNIRVKRVVGYATIIDSVEMSIEKLKEHNDKHHANDFLDKYANGRQTLFAWILENIEVEANPYPYPLSTGPWCRIK